MEYRQKVQVLEIKVDVPILNAEFVQIALGYKMDIKDPRMNTPIFKHIIHIFIPKGEWRSQYKMWEEYEISIDDSGNMSMQKVSEGGGHD